MRLDSHQHFWRYNASDYVWMNDEMEVLRRDYLPGDLEPRLRGIGFDGTIAVQARQMEQETEWLLELADQHPFIGLQADLFHQVQRDGQTALILETRLGNPSFVDFRF